MTPPPGVVAPHFFHQSDRKRCKGDYLQVLSHFRSVLERPEIKRTGGCKNSPLGKTRVNINHLLMFISSLARLLAPQYIKAKQSSVYVPLGSATNLLLVSLALFIGDQSLAAAKT